MKQTYIFSLVLGASIGLGACASRTDTGASQPASTPTSTASTSSPGSSSANTSGSTANTTRSGPETTASSARSSSTAGQTDSTRSTQSNTAASRSTQSDANSADRSSADATSLTGCLMKGDGADSYVLVDEATGKKTMVTGTADLAKHATHRVTLMGASGAGSGTFTVTKIQHLSPTCHAKQQ